MSEPVQPKVKVGVFGVGSLGQHHVRIYSAMEGVELVGVFDTDSRRAAEIAAKYGISHFEDMESLASNVQAASVVVPTDLHCRISTALMEKGLHLLVEKPIAANTTEAETMVETARRKNVILQVGHIERFNPVMQFLEDRLTAPRFIEAVRLAPYPAPRENALPRGTEVSVVLDLMIHDLDIILHLVRSPIKEIHAVGVAVLSNSEDIANARIIFQSGCVANVTASRISQDKMRKIRVFQHDTYVSLDYMNQTGQVCRKEKQAIAVEPVPIEKEEPLLAELRSFVNCVAQSGAPIVSGVHASEALKLAVEICRHIRETPS